MEKKTNNNNAAPVIPLVTSTAIGIKELPGKEGTGNTLEGKYQELEASDLFSLFTADIIKQEAVFTR